ncbi:MAG: serpin family protein [Acidimicrobiia bacterium]
MNRRELLMGSLAAVALAACGGGSSDGADGADGPDGSTGSTGSSSPGSTGSTGGGVPDAADVQTLRSDVARAASINPTGKGAALLPMSVSLYREVAAEAEAGANLVFSPISVAFALAMATNGAVGPTLEELLGALGFGSVDELNVTLNDLGQALEARSGERQFGPERKAEVTLDLANSLWGQRGLAFEQAFLDALAAFYGAGLQTVDYRQAAEAARVAINAWVAEATNAKITDLLAPGTLDEMTRLVLVNAVYLKAPWLEPFPDDATAPGPFTLASGEEIEVELMSLAALQGAYARGDGWTAVELPYLGGELAMTILVPDAGRWAAFEAGLSAEVLGAVVGGLEQRKFFLKLPKWQTRTRSPLVPMLQRLGVQLAFTDGADFSAMTRQESLLISEVIQEAFIAVDEQGTEAAAATAVVMAATSAEAEPPPTLDVDRPFLYAIRDRQSQAVLFIGRVLDPREG